ncbi:hypothetical protein HYALB_00005364 [Hymenoscyphus albidus]|uniref:Uncharacterized protein n=1 Tax=Hymenoscyphus albidus TaxID=595503 RepID=A0A9N9LG81_9HELO|nr:hypothetical protein HYALB_00005364 [Hymenoscyphus albidus]
MNECNRRAFLSRDWTMSSHAFQFAVLIVDPAPASIDLSIPIPDFAVPLPTPTDNDKIKTTLRKRKRYISPAGALFSWLNKKSLALKRNYFNRIWTTIDHLSIHAVVLHRLNANINALEDTSSELSVSNTVSITTSKYDLYLPRNLRGEGITEEDISHWVWIFSGENPKAMLHRFLEKPPIKSHVLLLRILQWDITDVQDLRRVLIFVWKHILRVPQPDKFAGMADASVRISTRRSYRVHGPISMDDHTFGRLVSLLARHVRKIWPEAMPNIACMLIPYSESIFTDLPDDCRDVDLHRHRRLCTLYNRFLRRFELPASLHPLASMKHNWSAQRKLLELGGDFQPPLILNERSFQAIATVMAASRKTARESKVATLRSRDWPPWRIAQDGMDALSTPQVDTSRVLLALAQKANSGYAPTIIDALLKIAGGQELDGTPTIHTRRLMKFRQRARQLSEGSDPLDPNVWGMRIEATRDVQEAWSAFIEFENCGGVPTQATYYPMLMKLQYEGKRLGHEGRKSKNAMAPGDAREVMAVAKNNYSKSYQSRLQPPSFLVLYHRMVSSGIRPSGRCLNFLIQRAPSLRQGLIILREGKGIPFDSWLYISGKDTLHERFDVDILPEDNIFSVVHMLCRFLLYAAKPRVEGDAPIAAEAKEATFNPLPQAIALVKRKLPMFRPTWYTLFKALSRRDVVVSLELAGEPENDILAWQLLRDLLSDFHRCGLELDPDGFVHICSIASKAFPMLATLFTVEASSALELLKREFAKLVDVQKSVYDLPQHLHRISGHNLHLYVRVMGIAGQHEEIIKVLRWTVENYEYLQTASMDSVKEQRHMRKLFMAIRVFLSRTEFMKEADDLVEEIPDWEGWASDEEIEEYVRTPDGRG